MCLQWLNSAMVYVPTASWRTTEISNMVQPTSQPAARGGDSVTLSSKVKAWAPWVL